MSQLESSDRLMYVKMTDPEWGCLIQDLFDTNPEFRPYIGIVPMTRYPMGYGLNPGEPSRPDMPQNMFEHLIYYIAEAGVNSNYGHKQWDLISQALRSHDGDLKQVLCKFKSLIQPKKVQTYIDLAECLKPPMNLSDLDIIKEIKGIGIGAIAQIRHFYSDEIDTASLSDRGFISGLMKIYNFQTKPSLKVIKEIVKKWGHAQRAGDAMCFQVFRYG